MGAKIGKQSVKLDNKPRIVMATSVVGKKEGEGPLKDYFDIVIEDDMFGTDSFEKAERRLLYKAVDEAIKKAKLTTDDIDYLFAGDLLNQITTSSFTARDLQIPFYGLYGACSTMTEAISLSAMLVEGNLANNAIAATASHFSSAERQYRFPLEYGSQRKLVSQWTVTGSGAMIIAKDNKQNIPYVTYITTGKVKDYGIIDANNMGAAMAPAAVDTLKAHFQDTGRMPDYYDLIVTGDLGKYGKEITSKLLLEYNYDIRKNYIDCGDEIFDDENQGTCAGGSGPACSATVFSGNIYKRMMNKEIKKVLLISTGALLSTTSSQQGDSIPGIAHAVAIEMD